MKYGFIRSHHHVFGVRTMCLVRGVQPSGSDAWLREPPPLSERAKEDRQDMGLVKQTRLEGGCVYGYRKIHDDLRNLGEHCRGHRV